MKGGNLLNSSPYDWGLIGDGEASSQPESQPANLLNAPTRAQRATSFSQPFQDIWNKLEQHGLVNSPNAPMSVISNPQSNMRDTLNAMANLMFTGTVGPFRAYKGMPSYNWETGALSNLEKEMSPGSIIDPVNGKHAGFYSNDPAVASRFAESYQKMLNEPPAVAIYPMDVQFENPVTIDAGGKPAAAIQFESIARQHNSYDGLSKFKSAFNDPTVDGIIIKNTKDEGTIYIPRAPSQVRSPFRGPE